MNLTSDTSGLTALRTRLTEAKSALPLILVEAAQSAGDAMAQKLGDAAPQGQGGGSAPPGDSPGRLADSFRVIAERQADSGVAEVRTIQPQKLEYVTQGTGIWGPKKQRIVPVKARALYWEGADHPYRSVAGQRPNDFVTPVTDQASSIAQPAIDKAVQDLAVILGGQ